MPSKTHLVLIPSYNTGARLAETLRAARAAWAPVWVVIDGSTDASAQDALRLAQDDPHLRVIVRTHNGGKGSAMLEGLREAERAGFTHVLAMDADGQHPAQLIAPFMALSRQRPEALILGAPLFDAKAPRERVLGRKIANWWVNLETLWAGIEDCLFGFRVYPVRELRAIMEKSRWMRGFDFDAEAVVRLSWLGMPVINVPAPVRYFTRAEGGVSHFNYVRDNALLVWMNIRLVGEAALRLPRLAAAHRRARAQSTM